MTASKIQKVASIAEIIRRLIYLFQNEHYQRRKHVVDDELWSAWLASLDEFLAEPGFSETLTLIRPHLSAAFVELVDARLDQPQ